MLRGPHLSDRLAGLDRGATRHRHLADLNNIGQRNNVSGRGDGSRTAKIDQRPAKIDNEETEDAEYDGRIDDAHGSSRCTPAALHRIRDIGIEAMKNDVHQVAPSPNSARRTRGGTKSSRIDAAKRISDE